MSVHMTNYTNGLYFGGTLFYFDLTVARQNAHVHNITNGSRIMKQW